MTSITDPRSLAPFRKSPGQAFQIIERKTDWMKVGKLGLQFLGGCALVIFIISPFWSQS